MQNLFKKSVDFGDDESRLKLIREIVALANSGGGRILIGVGSDGSEPGLSPDLAAKLDHAAIDEAVDGFIAPDRLPIRVSTRATNHGNRVAEIDVPPASAPPLVLGKPGEVERNGEKRAVFVEHTVPVRRGSRIRSAGRNDYRRWTAEAVAESRSRILNQLAMVVEAPANSRVRIIDEAEVRDEPGYFLSRSADLFAVRPERLLDGNDLVFLWLNRRTLSFDLVAGELIFQSALRKRSTLFLWLYTLQLPLDDVQRYVRRAVDMQDRDKSDGARSMLQIAAFFFDKAEYTELRDALAASNYAHMREAAAEWPKPDDALASLGSGADDELVPMTETELLTQAEDLLASAGRRVARQVTSIGVELLQRRQDGGKTR